MNSYLQLRSTRKTGEQLSPSEESQSTGMSNSGDPERQLKGYLKMW